MQIIAIRKTGEVDGVQQEVFVQQIYVSGTNDAILSDAVDYVLQDARAIGLDVQYRDDAIPDEVRDRILQSLFTT